MLKNYNLSEVIVLKNNKEYFYNFDNIFGCREILTKYLCDCGIPTDEAFQISEKARKGFFYKKEYTHSKIPQEVTAWFGSVKYLPSVRRLLDDEQE